MKTYEVTGKTYEEALSNGLSALGATISDVTIEVLEEGSKGLFGLFGSRPYKLRLTLTEEAEEDPLADLLGKPKPEPVKAEPRPAPRAQAPEKPVTRTQSPVVEKPQPKAEAEAPKAPAQPTAEEEAPATPAAPAAAEKSAMPKPVQRKARSQAEKAEKKTQEKKQERPAKVRASKPPRADKPQEAAEPAAPKRPLPPKEPVKPMEKPVVTMLADEDVVADSAAGKAQTFLRDLTRLMGVDVTVAVGNDADGNVYVQMTGDTLGVLIGRRGETLDALQYLTSLKVNRGQENYTRVTLDTENYRAKREDTLIRLANRMANRAVKTGRRVSLEPMNPYERRIIHSALQQNEAVDTHSEGEEPNRHVVITLRK